MRTIRGLQITSIVVLSPVLLIMLSLVSMLFFSIYSQLTSWLFQTTPTQQQLLFIRNITTDISIPQRTNKQYTIAKRARFFLRLRQSPIIWTIIIFVYAIYLVFKRKQKQMQLQQQQQQWWQQQQKEEDLLGKTITKPISKKKSSKRNKKPKKLTTSTVPNRQRTRSMTMSSCSSEDTIVNRKPQNQEKQVLVEVLNSKDWIDVGEKKRQPDEDKDEGFADSSPALSCITPPVSHSSDPKGPNSWYSPFSTGLDLDILPKSTYIKDPLCLYHIQNTIIPNNYHHFISTFHTPQKPTCIQLLENHPFIPSPSSTTFKHNFGPIGDKIKKSKTLV